MSCKQMIEALEKKLKRKLTLEEKREVQERAGHIVINHDEEERDMQNEEMLVVA